MDWDVVGRMSVKSHIHFMIRLILMTLIFYIQSFRRVCRFISLIPSLFLWSEFNPIVHSLACSFDVHSDSHILESIWFDVVNSFLLPSSLSFILSLSLFRSLLLAFACSAHHSLSLSSPHTVNSQMVCLLWMVIKSVEN